MYTIIPRFQQVHSFGPAFQGNVPIQRGIGFLEEADIFKNQLFPVAFQDVVDGQDRAVLTGTHNLEFRVG